MMQKNRFKIGFILFLILVFNFVAKAQFYSLGEEPAYQRWEQIRTENFQLIFPKGQDSVGQYVANILEQLFTYTIENTNDHPKKVTLVLHSNTVVSNAFVTTAPRRTEWYLVPPQDLDATPWLKHLAIHEYTHVIQLDRLNVGLTKFLSYFFGEEIIGAVSGLYTPMWMLEGEAVCRETALSNGGRGRNPEFTKYYKSQLLEKGSYSFDKACLGSYVDFVPNQYEMGYFVVASAMHYYGKYFWDTVYNTAGRKPWMITPGNHAVKTMTSLSRKKLFVSLCDSLLSTYGDEQTALSANRIVSPEQKRHTEYHFPFLTDEGKIIALKKSLDDIQHFVLIDTLNQKEEILYTPSYLSADAVSFKNGKLFWTERKYDPRWDMKSYSELWQFDLKTKKPKRLTKKSHLFAPDASEDGKRIVAVTVDKNGTMFLAILDAESGEMIQKNNLNYSLMTPKWKDENIVIVVVQNPKGAMSLLSFNVKTGNKYLLFPFVFRMIRHPFVKDNNVYYTMNENGVNSIFRFNLELQKAELVVKANYAMNYVSLHKDKILCCDYSSDGYKIVIDELKQEYTPFQICDESDDYDIYLTTLKKNFPLFKTRNRAEDSLYKVKPYRKFPHLMNIHSWGVFNPESNKPGFVFLSQNMLSTAVLSGGYEYDNELSRGEFFLDYSFKAWYPVFSLRLSSGKRVVLYPNDSIQLMKNSLNLRSYLPLFFHRGKWNYYVQPSVSLTYAFPWVLSADNERNIYYKNYVNTGLYAHVMRKRSLFELQSKWGAYIHLNYASTYSAPFNKPMTIGTNQLYSVEMSCYTPSVFKNHRITWHGGLMSMTNNDGSSYFNSLIDYPIGHSNSGYNPLTSWSVTYKMILWHPDKSIGPFAYLKRLKLHLYYGNMSYFDNQTNQLSTYGAELRANLHILRFIAPIEMGFGYYYLGQQDKPFYYQFLFNVNFDAL